MAFSKRVRAAVLFFGFSLLAVAGAPCLPIERPFPLVEKGSARAVPPLADTAISAEAEDGDFFGVKEGTDMAGYSGSGYVRFPAYDATTLALSLAVESEGYYCLRLRCAVAPGADSLAQVRIEVDDDYLVAQRLPVKGVFADLLVNKPAYLQKGEHRFLVTSLKGEWSLDKLYLEPLTPELFAAISARSNLATPDPLPAAQAVYRYLLGMQGKGTLSGQQVYTGVPEINAIFETTGKYPAILGVDFIDASPSRVANGARSYSATEAIKYWKKGGLVAACWHWNAPRGLIDKEPDKQWYYGFYTRATTFDLAAALGNPGGADYALLLRDIDAIAAELKKLQAAGVPVLWRPLHEASGGWFWWGAKGPEAYLKLYKLLFDRLTVKQGLRNLIWVWNGQDPEWYPGDDYADILSWDIYPDKRDYQDQAETFAKAQACAFEPKLVAMSENGTLPNIEKIAKHKIEWSWYCTWNSGFVIDGKTRKYSEEYSEAPVLKSYFDNSWLIARGALPSFTQ